MEQSLCSSLEKSSPVTFLRCTFSQNAAGNSAGAVKIFFGHQEFDSCLFEGNSAGKHNNPASVHYVCCHRVGWWIRLKCNSFEIRVSVVLLRNNIPVDIFQKLTPDKTAQIIHIAQMWVEPGVGNIVLLT